MTGWFRRLQTGLVTLTMVSPILSGVGICGEATVRSWIFTKMMGKGWKGKRFACMEIDVPKDRIVLSDLKSNLEKEQAAEGTGHSREMSGSLNKSEEQA